MYIIRSFLLIFKTSHYNSLKEVTQFWLYFVQAIRLKLTANYYCKYVFIILALISFILECLFEMCHNYIQWPNNIFLRFPYVKNRLRFECVAWIQKYLKSADCYRIYTYFFSDISRTFVKSYAIWKMRTR